MPTTLDPQKVVALQDRDLATIREEVAASCPYLGHALGFPVELLVVDANNAVFMAENSLVTAEYAITEDDQITFDNIEIHEGVDNPTKLEKTQALVEAIINDRMAEADQIWPTFESAHISDFVSRRRLEQLSESVSFDNPAKVGLVSVVAESIDASRSYFRSDNFDCLSKLEELRATVKEAIEDAIDSDEPLGEASYYTARGGKKTPKRVKVDRKKRRLSKKYARKNRAALIRRLKKARRKLVKMFRKPAFRRRMARVRRLNDAREVDQIVTLFHETIAEEPNIAYLTVPEIAEQVTEALKMEGVKNYTDEFVQEAATALAIMARNVYPESRRYIAEAALAFLPPSYNTPSDDPFESLEHINALLWEKVAEEEGKKEDVIKMTHELVSSLVDTLTDDMENASDEDEEAKEINSVLEKLKGYRDDLAGFDENPEEADLKKVKSILDYVAGLMDVEEDEEDEGEGSDDSGSEDDDSGSDDSGSEDDDTGSDDGDDDGGDDDGGDDDGSAPPADNSGEEEEEEIEDDMKRRKTKKESTAPGQMIGDEHDSDFYGDGEGKTAKKPDRLPGGVKTKNEGACATKTDDMGCSDGDKKGKKAQRMSYNMSQKKDDYDMTEGKTPGPTPKKAKKPEEQDQDPEFYGAGGKANTAGQKKDTSQAPYDESLAHKLFGGGGGSHPKSEPHGEQSDHPVSENQDREPLLEGYSMTRDASQALKDLMKALGNDRTVGTAHSTPGLGSNEWKRGKDRYFYEIESEDQEDGGIKGEVIKGSKSIGSFHIDGNGYIVKFPGASSTAISKVNKGKERRKSSEVKSEGKKSDLSVPEQHQKKIALRTLQMNDVGVDVMGGMTKAQAREFLKSKCGYTEKQISKLEESVLVTEDEEVYVPEKAREQVKKWADAVGAVVQFNKDGKAKIPTQHMQAFKANFNR